MYSMMFLLKPPQILRVSRLTCRRFDVTNPLFIPLSGGQPVSDICGRVIAN
jgi:hypothetical protein